MRVLALTDIKNSVVAQSNRLIESRYTLTVGEQRLILAMASLIHPEDDDFIAYEIKISDLAKILNTDQKNAYREADKITDRIMERFITIPEEDGLLKVSWVSSCKYNRKRGSISFQFDPNLKPYLLKLKAEFTSLRLTVVAQFKSIYTIRIYGLLKQYERIGSREIDYAELRAILGIEDSQYPVFKDFRKRVLDQAKKEFESKVKPSSSFKSDLTFDLETIRKGRKITRLRFVIRKQTYQEELPLGLTHGEAGGTKPVHPLVERLHHYGVVGQAEKFVEEKGEEAIKAAIELYEERISEGLVKDLKGGYLATLIREGAGVKSQFEREEEAKAAAKSAKAKADLAAQKLKEAEEKKAQAEKNTQLMEKFESLDPEAQGRILEDFSSYLPLPAMRKKYKEHGIETAFTKGLFLNFISERFKA